MTRHIDRAAMRMMATDPKRIKRMSDATDVVTLLNAVDEVMALHRGADFAGVARCVQDGLHYPCPTARALGVTE